MLVHVTFDQQLGSLNIDRMALGQGGLSDQPMWESRIAEVRALHPGLIRLFVQEYFQLLPARGRHRFETLDHSVETILKTVCQILDVSLHEATGALPSRQSGCG